MNRQTFFLVSVALVLATLYIAFFTDWLKPRNIHVYWRPSPASGAIVFYLDKAYALTSVEVVSTDDAKTNKHPHALWHMVSEPGSKPTSTFNYGASIPGMKPEIASALPEQLQLDTDYSLVVRAGGKLKGEQSFTVH
jgi:hypothetical protein